MSSVLPWMRALAQLAHHLPPAHVATTPWGRAISQLAAALPHIPQGDQPRALDRADDDDDRRFASCYHHTVKTAAQSKNWQLATALLLAMPTHLVNAHAVTYAVTSCGYARQ
eukprot:GEMP01134805.1.p1 GENE.GEMP01134805.1~~GEMP01134805.1.p1  ORF type:complete len:112 (+),score=37.12 GEMP01134805.1:128-463(+)